MRFGVRDRLPQIEARISDACRRSGRAREEITLIAVTKTFSPAAVDEAIEAGLADIGENRVQEAGGKRPAVGGTARWHMIGHLQSNKSKDAVRLFEVVQTVDSAQLAERLGKAAGLTDRRIDVLIQVNLAGEAQKSGSSPDELESIASTIAAHPGLRLTGLMTIPPFLDPEGVRPYFRKLRELRDELRQRWGSCAALSMGMSDDFEVAIEEGATMIRLGRALFGERT